MSIPASNSTIPVDSHPLSPEELKTARKPARRRAKAQDENEDVQSRPTTGYFSLRKPPSQDLEPANGYAHDTFSSSYTHHATADWDGSVRGITPAKKPRKSTSKDHLAPPDSLRSTTSSRASTLSMVWDKPSVPLFIVGSSKSSEANLKTPPGTPLHRPLFTLSPSQNSKTKGTLHDLPVQAASHVLSTQFHTLDDSDIQNAISDLSVLAEEEHVSYVTRLYIAGVNKLISASVVYLIRIILH